VRVYDELESRVRTRTRALEAANEELESFTYAVSHDLRAPVRALSGEIGIMLEEFGALDPALRTRLQSAKGHVARMYELIDDLLRLSGITPRELTIERFDLGAMAAQIVERLRNGQPQRAIDLRVERGVYVDADRGLMSVLMDNLLSNAWKYTSQRIDARIEFRTITDDDSRRFFQVIDNGAGFDPRYSRRLFQPFQRLHSAREFAGTGVGLATVQRIVRRHDGEVWGESDGPDRGATFSFTLGTSDGADAESCAQGTCEPIRCRSEFVPTKNQSRNKFRPTGCSGRLYICVLPHSKAHGFRDDAYPNFVAPAEAGVRAPERASHQRGASPRRGKP